MSTGGGGGEKNTWAGPGAEEEELVSLPPTSPFLEATEGVSVRSGASAWKHHREGPCRSGSCSLASSQHKDTVFPRGRQADLSGAARVLLL